MQPFLSPEKHTRQRFDVISPFGLPCAEQGQSGGVSLTVSEPEVVTRLSELSFGRFLWQVPLYLQFLYCRLYPRTMPFVATVLFCVEPWTVERAMQVIGKHVKLTRFHVDLSHTRFAVGEVVEVMRTFLYDMLYKLVIFDFYCFHTIKRKAPFIAVFTGGCFARSTLFPLFILLRGLLTSVAGAN